MNEDFYNLKEWKVVRYAVLRNSNGWCRLCGRGAKDGVQLHVDHIVPVSKNRKLALVISNLQVLCSDCNIGKSNTDNINWERQVELTKSMKRRCMRKSMSLLNRTSYCKVGFANIQAKRKKNQKKEKAQNQAEEILCVGQPKIILRKGLTT